MTPVLLKWWSLLFDPDKENLGAGVIWVCLPGLPLQFWAEEVFRSISDDLGVYLDHDQAYQDTCFLALARMLVQLHTR